MGIVGLAALTGSCAESTLELERPKVVLHTPEELDLGWIVPGEPVTAPLVVANLGKATVTLTGGAPLGALPAGISFSCAPESDGRLGPDQTLELTVQLSATERAAEEVRIPIELGVLGLSPGHPELPQVIIRARVTPTGLIATPNPMTLGPVEYLASTTGTVAIRNVSLTAKDIFAVDHDGFRAQYAENVARGVFGPLPVVDSFGRIGRLEPGEELEVDLSYTAPSGPGEAKEQAVWWVTSCTDAMQTEACRLRVVVQGIPDDEAPRIAISPRSGDFGDVPVGERVELENTLSNAGLRPLQLTDIQLVGSSSFETDLVPMSIANEAPRQIKVSFTPVAQLSEQATLTFATNDPLSPTVTFPLSGAGVVLPPCDLRAVPSSVNYGEVELNASSSQQVIILNEGTDTCLAFAPRITLEEGVAENTFSFTTPPPASRTLGPNQGFDIGVTYAPTVPGRHVGNLQVRTSGDDIDVPLVGKTPGPPGLFCVESRTTQRDRAVAIAATLTNETATSYVWEVTQAPTGGVLEVYPNHTTGPTIQVRPRALGTYRIRATVQTSEGNTFDCETEVVAEPGPVAIRMLWDGAGDLDLHLHNELATPWFSEDDCYFDNLQPSWTSGGVTVRPSLDRDDTSGDGPETILVSELPIGVTYALAVSHFERAAGRKAQVQLRCGNDSPSIDLESRPFRGSETGECTGNDFWEIATFRMTGPDTCEVEIVDEYRSTRDACVER